MKNFQYKKSYRIIYWGCCFDSLLELKYAISISDEYEFMHARIPVYYDLKTKRPTDYIRDCTRRYTPDFLIRHKITGEAFWVEIKPKNFDGYEQLSLRKIVAENFIAWKNFDWKFKVVFGDEIVLNKKQQELFEELCRLKSKSAYKVHFQKLNNQFDRSAPSLFVPSQATVQFVMFGRCKILSTSGGS